MKKLKTNMLTMCSVAALCLSAYASAANAETLVVVGANSPIQSLDAKTAKKFWMGKKKRLNGQKIAIVDQNNGSSAQAEFYRLVLGKNTSEMKAYWAKLVFTGSTFPPRKLENDAQIKDWVAKNPNSMGYIDAGSLDDTVRVLLAVK
jgi:ABC-type phosphate transport system substrate-binding protein